MRLHRSLPPLIRIRLHLLTVGVQDSGSVLAHCQMKRRILAVRGFIQ